MRKHTTTRRITMKSRFLLILIAGIMLSGFNCKIVDPFLIALNLPLEVCGTVNAGNSWDEQETFNIRDEIAKVSSSYPDQIKATRVSDISVYMPNPPSSGSSSGFVRYALGGQIPVTLFTFTNVPFDSLRGKGISYSNTGLVQFNQAALTALIAALENPSGLPVTTTITVISSGTTTVTVPQGTQICAKIHYQADAEISS
jgi:hypothetical protein